MTGRTKSSPTEKCPKQLRWECSSCSPNLKLETPRLLSGAACYTPETTGTPKLPPIPEVVLQQPLEPLTDQYSLDNTNNDSTIQCTQNYNITLRSWQLPSVYTMKMSRPFLRKSSHSQC